MKLPEKALRVELKAGKGYEFCTCGHSQSLPYCNQVHKVLNEKLGTSYKPTKIYPETNVNLSFHTANWDNPVFMSDHG